MTKYFFIFAGPNGSGKSSVIDTLKNDKDSSPINYYCDNLDEIPYINADYCARTEPFISQMPNGPEKDFAAWEKTNEWRDKTLNKGYSCIWETVFSHESRLEVIRNAQKLGYFVIVIFVTTINPDINVERVNIRVKNNGHGVPEDKIRSRYEKSVGFLPDIMKTANEVYVYDNSGIIPVLTFGKIGKELFVFNSDVADDETSKWVALNLVVPLLKNGENVIALDEIHTLMEINASHYTQK